MGMRLKNYTPAKNDVVLELRHYSKIGGVYTPTPQADKIMRVLATGPRCEITKVGDLVLMNSALMATLEFELEELDPKTNKPKTVVTLQGTEFNVMGFYKPDENETNYKFIEIKAAEAPDSQGPQNIIDNPGIDQSPFLKEQSEFIKNLAL
jgi:hypothetical protein